MKTKDGDKRIGNQFWKLADPEAIGRPRIFKTPLDLWEKVKEYFQWVDENPIVTKKIYTNDKGTHLNQDYLIKPYTWEGLYVFLGVCNLDRYKEKEEFAGIITHIGNCIRNQKFEGAASGIFNPNIIARDLGLKDSSDVTSQGKQLPSAIFIPASKADE